MLIAGQIPQALAAGKNENVYTSVYNNFGTLIAAGSQLCLDSAATAAQFRGRAVNRPATAILMFYCGVAAFDIPIAQWGLCCAYGVFELAFVDGGTTDIAVGNQLIVANGTFYANQPTAGTQGQGWIIAMEIETSTSVTGRVFIRAM